MQLLLNYNERISHLSDITGYIFTNNLRKLVFVDVFMCRPVTRLTHAQPQYISLYKVELYNLCEVEKKFEK